MAAVFKLSNLKKTYYYLKRNGAGSAMGAVLERVFAPYYRGYTYQMPEKERLEAQRQKQWENPVVFSVVVPAYETKKEFLRVCIDSLLEQTYPHWELVLADASKSDKVKQEVEQYHDDRIRYYRLKENLGISENTNQGIEKATGDYIGLLDHDDYLTPDALYEMANALEKGKAKKQDYGILYSDEDKCDVGGKTFFEPHFKTEFNLDLFFTNNYICHFCVMKKELMQTVRFRKEYDGAQDYDMVLRAVGVLWDNNKKVEETICHIPKVLYHWRCHNDSTAANPLSKRYAYDAGKRALQDFVEKRGWRAKVEEMPHVGYYKVVYENGIFAQREDVIAMAGKEIRHGKVVSGIYGKDGKMLYQGLPSFYSGYMHGAVLPQNAAQMDREKWIVNPKFQGVIETFLKKETSNKQGTDKELQKSLCEYLMGQGYRLYWDPCLKSDGEKKHGKKYRNHSKL